MYTDEAERAAEPSSAGSIGTTFPSVVRFRMQARTRRVVSVGLLVTAITAVNLLWAMRDHTTPSFDQSHYLGLAYSYQQAIGHGLRAFWHQVYIGDPGRAPVFQLLILAFDYMFGPEPRTGLFVNVFLWPVLLLCTAAIAHRLFNRLSTELLAIIMLAAIPEVWQLSHTALQDFLLGTLTTAAFLLLLRTEYLTRPWRCAQLGILLAVGSLTKFSFLIDAAVPVGIMFFVALVWPNQLTATRQIGAPMTVRRRVALNGVMVAALAFGIPLIWYIPNLAGTEQYLRVTFAQQPGVIGDPYTISAMYEFTLSIVNAAISWVFIICLAVASACLLPQLRRLKFSLEMTTTVLLVGSWTLIPLLSVMLSDNQDPRYAVAAYPGIAVLTAAAVTFVRVAIVRWGLAVIIVGYSVIMMSSFSFANFAIPGVPSVWVVNTPKEVAYIKPNGFGGAPVGTDFALTVLQTLEHNAPNHGRTVTPVPVAVLELNGDVNGNNMPYYNSIAGTNFTFTVLPPMSASQAQSLGSTLLQYKFVLFRHLVPESEDVSLGRVAQLNDQAASRYVTAKTLHGFRLVASIDGGADVGQGPRLYVYERAST